MAIKICSSFWTINEFVFLFDPICNEDEIKRRDLISSFLRVCVGGCVYPDHFQTNFTSFHLHFQHYHCHPSAHWPNIKPSLPSLGLLPFCKHHLIESLLIQLTIYFLCRLSKLECHFSNIFYIFVVCFWKTLPHCYFSPFVVASWSTLPISAQRYPSPSPPSSCLFVDQHVVSISGHISLVDCFLST